MAGVTRYWTYIPWWSLLFMTPGVSAADSSLVALVASGTVSFLFLVGVIVFIVLMLYWSDLFKRMMARQDKVRMPRAYWRKKKEAKRKLLTDSTPSVVNGKLPAQSVDRASWVQGWNQTSNQYENKVYEEKDVTIQLGEEVEEEFRIETVLTDNEVLDVGPFKSEHRNEQAIDGDIYPEPYIYTSVDKVKDPSPRDTMKGTTVSATVTGTDTSTEMQEVRPVSTGSGQLVTNFEDMLVQL